MTENWYNQNLNASLHVYGDTRLLGCAHCEGAE